MSTLTNTLRSSHVAVCNLDVMTSTASLSVDVSREDDTLEKLSGAPSALTNTPTSAQSFSCALTASMTCNEKYEAYYQRKIADDMRVIDAYLQKTSTINLAELRLNDREMWADAASGVSRLSLSKDDEEISHLQQLVRLGEVDAMTQLGRYYALGIKGLSRNYAKAVDLYSLAASQGDATAMSNLAMCLYRGHGVTQNYTEAVKYLVFAVQNGCIVAVRHLQYFLSRGQCGLRQNRDQAQILQTFLDSLCSSKPHDSDSHSLDSHVQPDTSSQTCVESV